MIDPLIPLTLEIEYALAIYIYFAFPIELKHKIIGGTIFFAANLLHLHTLNIQLKYEHTVFLFLIVNIIGIVSTLFFDSTFKKMMEYIDRRKSNDFSMNTQFSSIIEYHQLLPICKVCETKRQDQEFTKHRHSYLKMNPNEYFSHVCETCQEKS